MKKIYLGIVLVCAFIGMQAQSIDANVAKKVAENFYGQKNHHKAKTNLSLYSVKLNENSTEQSNALYYIFNDDNGGFVIVSGTEQAMPVLAYSTKNHFDTVGMPENIRSWLKNYENEILSVYQSQDFSSEVSNLWYRYKNDIVEKQHKEATSVEPLVQTTWNQGFPYNALCPFDSTSNVRTVTGCVATAMAQLMKYWSYPTKGKGSHSYTPDTHTEYGTQSANFANTTYQWASMPNNPTTSNNAVATLMYHCGVAVEMDYGTSAEGGSSASTLLDDYWIERGYIDARTALNRYFGYKTAGYSRSNFTDAEWIKFLKENLEKGIPLMYRGKGTAGGHAFICDGYNENDYFHFNWGWSGNSDGYYLTTALNPPALGIGGGSGGFNSGQMLIVAYPQTLDTVNIKQYSQFVMDSLVYQNTPFMVSTNIANYGIKTFNGKIYFDIYNSSNTYMGTIDSVTENIPFMIYQTVTMNSNGITYPEGMYYVVASYKETDSTKRIQIGNASDRKYFELKALPPAAELQLFSDITINPTELYRNMAFTVSADVINEGTQAFDGYISFDIYEDATGTYMGEIGKVEKNIAQSATTTITMNSNGVNYKDGLYYVTSFYQEKDSIKWEQLPADRYENKTYFEIKTGLNIAENQLWKAVLYPNPVVDKFYFKTTIALENTIAEIFDITGKSLYRTIINGEETIFDVSSYSSGVYVLKIGNNDNLHTYKIVKQ